MALVLLHGVGSTPASWSPFRDRFAGPFQVTAPPMPGYDGAPAPNDPEDAMRRLEAALPAGPCVLVGISLGAIAAVRLAAARPDRVQGLVLLSGFDVHPDGARILQGALAGSDDLHAFATARAPRLTVRTDSETLDALVEDMARIPAGAYRTMSHAVWEADLRLLLPSVRMPTLVVSGADDVVTPAALGRRLAEGIDGAQFHELSDCGHLLHVDQPDRLEALILDFLETLTASAPLPLEPC